MALKRNNLNSDCRLMFLLLERDKQPVTSTLKSHLVISLHCQPELSSRNGMKFFHESHQLEHFCANVKKKMFLMGELQLLKPPKVFQV